MDGSGELRFVRASGRTVVHTARARSPLRVLLPRNHGDGAWAYLAGLGGGLVDGDAVALDVEVGPGACAMVGTQASTKAYRSPRGTEHALSARVAAGATLALVPDPVSLFAGARYAQRIDVALEDASATLVLLDAFTSGRAARGERWAFARYASRLRVTVGGRARAADALVLDPRHGDLAARMGRFDAFATLVALGPRAEGVRAAIGAATARAPSTVLAGLLAGASADGCVGRLAAPSVRELLLAVRAVLAAPLAHALGDDPFARRW